MNVAEVVVEDACHTVKGKSRICLVEQGDTNRREWRLQIENGRPITHGYENLKFGANLKLFVQMAMQRTATEMSNELGA